MTRATSHDRPRQLSELSSTSEDHTKPIRSISVDQRAEFPALHGAQSIREVCGGLET
ncbi:hypothetical protein G6O69_08885 [Pseudenhygromyxa sp. WMMC2535]|uniref:hypothetical protein n=1 Tax=Pseudenhygromyxa sp. WMMC2535 TaxID=2712867 RepID=UPI0015962034|nr:hypothetical protein [Pseudenhygromyxa sp. WMMC2535]NVB37949.1 hypothetical protein [Pseudenhygromyxa sp. WMMC2535]